MKIPLPIDCPELDYVDSPPVPQLELDLCAIEYRKAQLGRQWDMFLACYWSGLIAWTLDTCRDTYIRKSDFELGN